MEVDIGRKRADPGPEVGPLESPVPEAGPGLVPAAHTDRKFPLPNESNLLCLFCANTVVWAEYLLSFWESGCWCLPGKEYPCGQSPVKTLGTESLVSFLMDEVLQVLPQLEQSSVSSATSLQEDSWEFLLACPDFTHVPFPFTDCVLCPSTVTSLSHESDGVRSPVSPRSE